MHVVVAEFGMQSQSNTRGAVIWYRGGAWCAVSATGIIRTIFFSTTVTGDRHIGQFLAPLFENLSDVVKEF